MSKLLIGCFGLLLVISCGSQQLPAVEGQNQGKASVKSEKRANFAFTDSVRLWGLVNYLASDAMKGRQTGSPEIEQAANFISDLLEQYNLQPFYPEYRDTLTNTKTIAFNIVGLLPGNDPDLMKEYILIGAHYDHIGMVNRINGDAIANGANDNASGTATVLELARYFARTKSNKRSLLFTFFSAEERGLIGSRHLAEKLKKANVSLYLVLNFEMTGVPMNTKDYLLYMTGYKKSNLAEVGNSFVSDAPIGYLSTEREYNLFQRSDNYPFYSVYKIPSHTFCTFDFNNYPHYHKPTDEPDALDYTHMVNLVNTMIPVVEGLANSREQTVKLK